MTKFGCRICTGSHGWQVFLDISGSSIQLGSRKYPGQFERYGSAFVGLPSTWIVTHGSVRPRPHHKGEGLMVHSERAATGQWRTSQRQLSGSETGSPCPWGKLNGPNWLSNVITAVLYLYKFTRGFRDKEYLVSLRQIWVYLLNDLCHRLMSR